jgi:hypothetical protein
MTTSARGALLARALAGSWRKQPPALSLSVSEFEAILPLAVSSGVGGLLWRRIRGTELEKHESAEELVQVYRHVAIQNALHLHLLKGAFALLRESGIEPVLCKGWSLNWLYPEPGSRPFGDIDLCVRPEQYQVAYELIDRPENRGFNVDLHSGFGKFYDDRIEELFSRSELVKADDTDIRILKFEDHLRFLCLHLLRHGANRAMWLCDVAAAIDAAQENFDWDLALGVEEPQRGWVRGAIGAAQRLLEVDLKGTAVESCARETPEWVFKAILEEWGKVYEFPDRVEWLLKRPVLLIRELPRHWPNPIEATVNLRGAFSDTPRLPLQVGEVFVKIARLVRSTVSG